MTEKILDFLELSKLAIIMSYRLILWNSFLAYIPLGLSYGLFRLGRGRSTVWWLGFLTFIAFLPNAPYVLTDTIHLKDFLAAISSPWVITFVVLPMCFIYIFLGFEAYVISLINLGYYLQQQKILKPKEIIWAELIVHGLSAVGIYLGRFLRFNSWDFVTKPITIFATLDDLLSRQPIIIMGVTFVTLTILYWLVKQVNLALIDRFRQVNHTSNKV